MGQTVLIAGEQGLRTQAIEPLPLSRHILFVSEGEFMLSTACELIGLAALDVAAFFVNPILGVAVFGAFILLVGILVGRLK